MFEVERISGRKNKLKQVTNNSEKNIEARNLLFVLIKKKKKYAYFAFSFASLSISHCPKFWFHA